MNYRDKNGKCTADTLAKRCKCDHAIVGPVIDGGECYAVIIHSHTNRECTSIPAEKGSGK